MFNVVKLCLKYFIVGVLALIPAVVVIQVILFLETILRNFFISIYGYSSNIFITLFAFLLSFCAIAYTGYRITKSEKLWLLQSTENFINRIPFIKTVYRVSKKLVGMLSQQEKDKHREIIFVEYPKEGLWVPGYITNKLGDMLVIYVPTSPNPTSGFTLVLHQSKVIKSNMSFEDISSFIFSIGIDLKNKEELEKLPGVKSS